MLARWNDPDRTFASFDALFRELAAPTRRASPAAPDAQVHLAESEDAFTLLARLPGVEVEDLVIEAIDDTLRISAARTASPPAEAQALHRERGELRLQRTLRFRTPVDLDAVSATLEKGLLTVVVPKAAAPQPRRIEVQVA